MSILPELFKELISPAADSPNSEEHDVPLTVSPFIHIPSAVTLPYTFRSVPTSLPNSIVSESEKGQKTQYIASASGHTAHPDDIIAACTTLQNHIEEAKEKSNGEIKRWQEEVRQRDLAEKRRVAPGWLDSAEKILEPIKPNHNSLIDEPTSSPENPKSAPMSPSREGEEIDRAFGSLVMK